MDSNRVNPAGFDLYFRYDRFNRLSDYMIAYGGSYGAVLWHKYEYVRPDYITDTLMAYETGDVRGPSPIAKNGFQYEISAYTLDQYQRIIKVWNIPIDSPNIPSLAGEMHYDANGNLPVPVAPPSAPIVSYDDKVNILRTNKVWQFLNKNYSRNNLVLLDGAYPPRYNAFGLPLNLRNLEYWYNIYAFYEVNYDQEALVTYACDAPKGPIDY